MKTLRHRYQQASKEALLSVMLALGYFIWWYGFGYGLTPEDVSSLPTLYFGFPLWFLVSCILGALLFTLLCAIMVKHFFKEMPLDIEDEHHE